MVRPGVFVVILIIPVVLLALRVFMTGSYELNVGEVSLAIKWTKGLTHRPLKREGEIGALVNKELADHTNEFNKKTIYKVTEGVHVAVGFGIANSILVEGPEGFVVIDTLEANEPALEVLSHFENIIRQSRVTSQREKKIVAVIYTHYHPDHVRGTAVFVNSSFADSKVDIYSHHLTRHLMESVLGVLGSTTFKRGVRQFGSYLNHDDEGHVNSGIGPFLYVGNKTHTASSTLLLPTVTFAGKELEVKVGGLFFRLLHAPGETDDQLFVHFPSLDLVVAADNIYRAFPNLYAIRGSRPRDAAAWVASLDLLRRLRPQHVVPCHTRPLHGRHKIYRLITDYRDGVQYVHDQTVRRLNEGWQLDDIVESLHLPLRLEQSPFLRPFYGTVAWSVRGVHSSYLGWFPGSGAELFPLSNADWSSHLLAAFSPSPAQLEEEVAAEVESGPSAVGVRRLLEVLSSAVEKKNWRWALKVAEILQRSPLGPKASLFVRQQKIVALRQFGYEQISANGRNYLLTLAVEEERGGPFPVPPEGRKEKILTSDVSLLFQVMTVSLRAELAENVHSQLLFNFSDAEKPFHLLHVRHGVAEYQHEDLPSSDEELLRFLEEQQKLATEEHNSSDPDDPLPLAPAPLITLHLSSSLWKEILAGLSNPALAYMRGTLGITGGSALQVASLLDLFRPAN